MRELSDDEKFIYKMAKAQLYGIYCDVEASPLDPEYCSEHVACRWDDATTNLADDVYEWLCDYYEDNEDVLKQLEKFNSIETEYKKWDFLMDLKDCYDIIPDEFSFYYYEMERRLVGVCFTINEAKRIRDTIDKELNPCIDVISRHELKGYGELSEVIGYFKKKAAEMFETIV